MALGVRREAVGRRRRQEQVAGIGAGTSVEDLTESKKPIFHFPFHFSLDEIHQ